MSGTQEDGNAFQKYPTNMLQFFMDLSRVYGDGDSTLDIEVILKRHEELLGSGVGGQMYEVVGMAGNSTILR